MSAPKILAFAGSTRKASWNKLLVKIAAEGATAAGAEVTYVDLADYPMPLFDEDLEAREGMPETVQRFKKLMLGHQGLLISSPEYNSSISAVLKNTIDWVSRKGPGELADWPFTWRVAALLSASPSGMGGLRGLVHLKAILGNIDVIVLPTTTSVSSAFDAFDSSGNLKDEKKQKAAEGVGAALAEALKKLR